MKGEHILEVENLSVAFGSEEVLRRVTFSVEKGEALAIIGPNGAGKTVLFRALLGLVPHQGEVRWQKDIRISYVPQRFFPDRSVPLTVEEFFLLKSSRFWFPAQSFLSHREHELGLAGLSGDVFKKKLSELSGGEFQRVLISWAMLDHPDVLLFDEPTAGIDVGGEETIYNIIHRLQDERGTTVLLISHDLNVVYRYAQKVLCLNRTLICHGVPEEVLRPEELAKIYGGGAFYHHLDHKFTHP